jgi:thioredoxin-related protein
MKRTLFILTLLGTLLYSNELKTVNSYRQALTVAENENKTVLFMTSIKSCPVCDYMKDIVFEREKVLDYLNKNYVVVIKDAETQIYPQRFYTRDMPTFYFINPIDEEEIREPKVGGLTPEKFLSVLQIAIEGEENNTSIPEVKEMEIEKKMKQNMEKKL